MSAAIVVIIAAGIGGAQERCIMKPYVLFVALLFPAVSFGQSPVSQYSSVVSAQQLAMPRKAARALEKGTTLLLKHNAQASIPYKIWITSPLPSIEVAFLGSSVERLQRIVQQMFSC
jgi:hypothetical protein